MLWRNRNAKQILDPKRRKIFRLCLTQRLGLDPSTYIINIVILRGQEPSIISHLSKDVCLPHQKKISVCYRKSLRTQHISPSLRSHTKTPTPSSSSSNNKAKTNPVTFVLSTAEGLKNEQDTTSQKI